MTFVSLLAFVAAIAAPQASPAPANPLPVSSPTELDQLSAQIPPPARYAKLLNVHELVTAEDYPPGALAREEEGRALAWLLVGADGRVERCGIETSSGSADLDAKTCEVLVAKAKFDAARDELGRPVKSIFHQPLSWALDDGIAQELLDFEASTPKPATPAKPLNMDEVASAMDYPRDALRHEEEGAVDTLLLIGVDGTVERCGVKDSSGSRSLDAQTCNLFLAHARFNPARNKRGKAVESIFHQRLVWKLQGNSPVGAHDIIGRTSMTIGRDNQVRDCDVTVTVDNQPQDIAKDRCSFGPHAAELFATVRAKSKAYEPRIVFEGWTISTAGRSIPDIGRGKGEVLLALRSASATYDASGLLVSCKTDQTFGFPDWGVDVCKTPGQPVPNRIDAAEGAAIRTVRWVSAFYLKGEPE